ncbi:MAG: carbonic anhydrase [Magnetococcales bacterium]|nr:carbonic anhydrase [Magnetococcales bacterium]
MASQNAVGRLLSGFKGFQAYYFEQRGELLESLVRGGQHPPVMLIGCSDARVDPAIMFHFEPGDVFTVRSVGNLVPHYDPKGLHTAIPAALEYAVRDLVVSHIVVLGHSRCGGIRELVRLLQQPGDDREFLSRWVSNGRKAVEQVLARNEPDAPLNPVEVEQAVIALSVENLLTYPWIAERVRREQLQLHGWWTDLRDGELWHLDQIDGLFKKKL